MRFFITNVFAATLFWFTTLTTISVVQSQSSVVQGQGQGQGQAPLVDERAILLEFYQATGGPSWNENEGWEEGSGDICEWYGVLCSGDAELSKYIFGNDLIRRRRHLQDGEEEEEEEEENDRQDFTASMVNKVMGLELPNNFLQGRTPASLWTLPLLQYLNVNYNEQLMVDFTHVDDAPQLSIVKLQKTATSSLVGLDHASTSLKVLHVSECPLKSALPQELFALTSLRDLQLAKCQLEGDLQGLAALTNLRDLNLFDNDLKGTLPHALTQLVRLEKLSISRNQMTGNLAIVDAWTNMMELYLAENQFVGPLPLLASMPRLRQVYLNQNRLTGTVPAGFLSSLVDYEPNLADDAPTIMVDLARNELSGELPASLDVLQELSVTWSLHDNEFNSVAEELCDNQYWNNGNVAEYGCDGMLCGNGTYSVVGHASNEHDCQPCEGAEFFGTTTCVQENDKSALLAFYEATQGASWINNDGWKQAHTNLDRDTTDICDWYGITCWDGNGDANDAAGRVRVIQLEANNLAGTIPEDIYSMGFLHTIKVARNPNLVVPMTKIGDSSQFRHLDVSQTATVNFEGLDQAQEFFAYLIANGLALGGTIPSQVTKLSGLKLLSMAECELIGTLPSELGLLTQLNELYLYDNHLRGTLPTTIGQMSALRVVSLAQNQLTGKLPTSLEGLKNLEALSLADQVRKGGGIVGPLHTFRFHPFLKSLQLSYNMLTGTLPAQLLEGAVALNEGLKVNLDHNRLSGRVPGELARFQQMDLALEGNQFTEVDEQLCQNADWMNGLVGEYGCNAILCPVGTSGGRQKYDSAPCQECPSMNENLGGMSKWMGQENCNLEFFIEESDEQGLIEMIFEQTGGKTWKSNRFWTLQKQQVDGGQVHVCDWYGISCDESKSIVGITLGSNNLIGTFPTEIYMLPKLELLSLFGNEKLVVPLEGIDNARNLRSLVLDSTGLTSLTGVGKARSLTELNVQSNALTGPIPEEISRLINLRSLSISKNAFDGPLPYWLNNLPFLETFLASDMNLSGPLPDFANFKSLSYLDLSNNGLSGEIPLNFLNSVNQEKKIVIDLSNNYIEGTVPRELVRLGRLTIHLKDNHVAELDREVCAAEGWNDFDVERYGCDGILCPVGTSSPMGRQTSDTSVCTPCKDAKYMGSTACYSSGARRASLMISIVAVFVSTAVAMATTMFG